MRRAQVSIVVALAAGAAALSLAAPGDDRAPPPIVTCTGAETLDFTCFERRLTGLVDARGAPAALRELAAERGRNGFVRAACHQLSHRVGRAAGRRHGIGAFADGTPLCSSGFYHGVTEAVMERIGAGRVVARAEEVCAALRRRDRYSADHYNCAHGMGHGFMGTFRTDVHASLRGCDALADRWDRRNCYGGVFMENLSAIGHPDRPPTSLRPDQPLYPCTAVARRYREPCFDKQTTYALYVTDGDYAKVFRLCARVERDFRGACHRGLGGDVATDTVKHLAAAADRAAARRRLCRLGPDRHAQRACVTGAIIVILRDLDGGAEQASALCRSLAAARLRDLHRTCRRAIVHARRTLPLQSGT